MCQTTIERISGHSKIIHEDLNEFFNHIREDCHHAPLESRRCIAQTEWHPSVGVRSVRTRERRFLLIFWCNVDLVLTRVSVQETVIFMTCQPFQHLVNEW